jgi:acetyltransferase
VAAAAMIERVRKAKPDATIAGFLVQEMIRRTHAHELILGASVDRQFGPVLLFGQGGVAVEVLRDTAMALPPLNVKLAREMIAATRVSRLLNGYRDRKPADLAAIERALVRLSRLICELDAVVEFDINPLLADEDGAIVLDARIRIAKPDGARQGARLAIEPYPASLARDIVLPTGKTAHLRPIRPEDAPGIEAMIARMTPEDRRMRFFATIEKLTREQLARLTQIDYDREMGLVCEGPDGIWGTVRLAADPDRGRAEYAIALRSDLKGMGIGLFLMRKILDYAKARGIGVVYGEILRENRPMLEVCKNLGFAVKADADAPDVIHAEIALADWPEIAAAAR